MTDTEHFPEGSRQHEAIMWANIQNAQTGLVICNAGDRLRWCWSFPAWSTLKWERRFLALSYPIESSAYGVAPNTEVPFAVTSPKIARSGSIFEALNTQKWDLVILDRVPKRDYPIGPGTPFVFLIGGDNDRTTGRLTEISPTGKSR
jgi:hypothetical protein